MIAICSVERGWFRDALLQTTYQSFIKEKFRPSRNMQLCCFKKIISGLQMGLVSLELSDMID